MQHLESLSVSTRRHCEYYKGKIAELTPPKSTRDERMVNLYRRLLIRDNALLHNLEVLKLSESMRLDYSQHSADFISPTTGSPALNINEIRNLLDENLVSASDSRKDSA